MGARRSVRACLDALIERQRPRAGSLAITLFGDCISQHGGSVWLGSLVSLMAEFGLNERQVRTALFRLVQDGWLSSRPLGRRSYYRLSEHGQRQFTRAAARIYAATPTAWDGEWTLVMPGNLEASKRDELRRRLGWLGFSTLANGILAHPRTDDRALEDTLGELELTAAVVVWRARTQDDVSLRELAHGAWDLDALEARLRAFLAAFEPVRALLRPVGDISPRDAFVLRSLLIHEYRRILLKSIDLPQTLLPHDWPGQSAMRLVRELYAAVYAQACVYACCELSQERGSLPPPNAAFYRRFGGLPQTLAEADGARPARSRTC